MYSALNVLSTDNLPPKNSVTSISQGPNMTPAVDSGCKALTHPNKQIRI